MPINEEEMKKFLDFSNRLLELLKTTENEQRMTNLIESLKKNHEPDIGTYCSEYMAIMREYPTYISSERIIEAEKNGTLEEIVSEAERTLRIRDLGIELDKFLPID